jgi:hypothetical protein
MLAAWRSGQLRFDIGGVLERVSPEEDWLRPWQERLGLGEPEFAAAMAASTPMAASGPAIRSSLPELAARSR